MRALTKLRRGRGACCRDLCGHEATRMRSTLAARPGAANTALAPAGCAQRQRMRKRGGTRAAAAARCAEQRSPTHALCSRSCRTIDQVSRIQRICSCPVQVPLGRQSAVRDTLERKRGSFDANLRALPWLTAGRWFSVRAGNPAVLGARARRPEALRPHLSVSLPLKSPVTMHSS